MGFVGAIGKEVPIGATYIYKLNFFCGFIISGGTYWILCQLFPVAATSDTWMEVGEEIDDPSMAYSAEEGSEFDGEGEMGKGTRERVERMGGGLKSDVDLEA